MHFAFHKKNNYSSCYFCSCQDRKSWPLCKTNWQCYLATCCLFFLCIGCSQKNCFRVLFNVICTICPITTIKSVWLGRLLFETFRWKQHTMFYVIFHTKRTTGEGSTIHGFGLIKKQVWFIVNSLGRVRDSGYQKGWIFGKFTNGLWLPPLIFGKLCCKYFIMDMVAYMQGSMRAR